MTLPMESYALIGDCETAALVGLDGSIDWLCWPRFDSQACLAALLGDEQNGCWRLAPTSDYRVSRRYRGDSLVLETTFECEEGAVTVARLHARARRRIRSRAYRHRTRGARSAYAAS